MIAGGATGVTPGGSIKSISGKEKLISHSKIVASGNAVKKPVGGSSSKTHAQKMSHVNSGQGVGVNPGTTGNYVNSGQVIGGHQRTKSDSHYSQKAVISLGNAIQN